MTRLEARRRILAAANARRRRVGLSSTRYYGRHIERAVFACRQNRLVPEAVLVDAGYRP